MKCRKGLALFLSAAVVLGAAGCADGGSTGKTGNTGAAGNSETNGTVAVTGSSQAGTKADGEDGKFDANGISKPGEFPISREPITMSVFVKQPADIADITKHTVFKELTELTNINFDFTVVPDEGAADKLNMLMASGDYQDIIFGSFTNPDLVKYGTTEEILIPLNDLIEENCVYLKERWAENPQFKDMMTTPDGNIYGIPSLDSGGLGHGVIGYKIWMNQEWLNKIGMEQPETTEEFRAVLQAFNDQDVNGNGDPNDEIPLTGAINTWAGDVYLYLLNAFDYFNPVNGYLKLKDGVFSGVLESDGIKEGLKYIAELYEDGLIDPAALTQDISQLVALGTKDEAICGAVTCGHPGMFLDINNQERSGAYDNLLPLAGPNGYRAIPGQGKAQVSGAAYVITDHCKYPEAAIKLADLFCSEEWSIRTQNGIKGKQWDDADEGTFAMDGVTPAEYKYLTYTTEGANETQDYKWGWVLRLIEPNWKGKFQVVGDIIDPTNYEARLQQCTDKLIPYLADAEDIPPFFLDEEKSFQISSMKTAIDDYVKASFVEFITGAKDVDKDWNAYLAGLNKLQYEDYVALNQEAYDQAYR